MIPENNFGFGDPADFGISMKTSIQDQGKAGAVAARKTTVSMKDVAALAGVSGHGLERPEFPDISCRANAAQGRASPLQSWVGFLMSRRASFGVGEAALLAWSLWISRILFTRIWFSAPRIAYKSVAIQSKWEIAHKRRIWESTQLLVLMQQRVRGVLLAPIWGIDERVRQLELRGIPVVLSDRAGNDADFCSVSVDDVEGGRPRGTAFA